MPVNPLLKTSLLYTLSSSIEKAIPFILLPFISVWMSIEDYGRVNNFTVLFSIFMLLVGSIGVQSFNRYFKNKEAVRKIFLFNGNMAALVLSVLLWIICLVIFLVVGENKLGIDISWILLLLAYVFGQLGFQTYTVLLRYTDQSYRFMLFQVLSSIADAGLTVYMLYYLSMGADGRVYALIFSKIIIGLVAYCYLFRDFFVVKFNTKLVQRSVGFAAKLFMHQVSGWAKFGLDKYIISASLGLAAVGVYAISFKIGIVVTLIASAGADAIKPFNVKKYVEYNKTKDHKILKQISRVVSYYCLVLFVIPFVLHYGFYYLSPYFLSEQYVSAREYVLPVSLGIAFMSTYYIFGDIIVFYEKPQLQSNISVVTTLLFIAGLWPVILHFGLHGLTWWFCLNQIIFAMVCVYFSNKCIPLYKGLLTKEV